MNRRVLPKYCFSIAKVVVTSFTKLVHIYYPKWLGECSSLRTQRCKNNLVRCWNCKLSSFTRVTSCESYGSSLLLQADLIINIAKGDNRCSLFGIHSNIAYKTSQELRKLLAKVSWKVHFKCQICPSCLSWVSCLSWWP